MPYFDIQSYQNGPSRPKKCPFGAIYKVKNNDFGFYWVKNRELQMEWRVYFISFLFSRWFETPCMYQFKKLENEMTVAPNQAYYEIILVNVNF